MNRIFRNDKDLLPILEREKSSGNKIVFTNGCFDIIHPGHIYLFKEARSLGDILVVGINSDDSIRGIKGDNRPLTHQGERAEILAAIEYVDYIIIFEETDPSRVINLIRPDILVKGADWPEDGIVGRETVESYGGRVARIELLAGYSTSRIIKQMRKGGNTCFT